MQTFRAGLIALVAPLLALALAGAAAQAQDRRAPAQARAELELASNDLVSLDFADVELSAVIETIARMTNKNFIYDDRVRGRVTIVSPTPMPVEQAYAVFESVLQVKGFTTVTTPGGAIKVVPVREAKESSIDTGTRRPPNRDQFVTRLIPLNYIDAESIVNTLKPLVSKDAAMAAYGPTNTVILTESASNIRRLIAILESIDVETYKEELAVLKVEHADAVTLAEQVSEIYGAEVATPTATTSSARRASRRRNQPADTSVTGAKRKPVRILTDERTNSLLVLAARQQLEEVRRLVAKLDVPVEGGGRIHVYYLRNANAEEMAQTLSGLIGGGTGSLPTQPGGATPPGGAPAIRSAVTSLAGGISVTADPATNSLIIQASKEGFDTLKKVIEKLDMERPQVLVEALIMEVAVSDGSDIGFNALLRTINGDTDLAFATVTDGATSGALDAVTPGIGTLIGPAVGRLLRNTLRDEDGDDTFDDGSLIDGIIRLSAANGDVNIISAPHILTSDNEQAEIRVGDNIPIITSRVEQPTGADAGLSSSVNVERQDVGVTLRVTPQITEGESLRLEIFQEITSINEALSGEVGNPEDVGVPLSNRRIENTVVVADGETVVIGGLIGDQYRDTVTKVPWFGDIPVLGWAFKSTTRSLVKTNLLVFLTPQIVRTPEELEAETIRKREEFRNETGSSLDVAEETLEIEEERYALATVEGENYMPEHTGNPLRTRMVGHMARYPSERMREIEAERRAEFERLERERAAASEEPRFFLQAAIFGNADAATALLTDLIDSGHDGTLIAEESGGSVLYELHLGPYESLREANNASSVVQRSHGLSPSVIVVEPEESEEEAGGTAP
ncbi:MAG: type II secretion system secretin GspD [Myxococcota bacterium]